jgi:hypothetical protein
MMKYPKKRKRLAKRRRNVRRGATYYCNFVNLRGLYSQKPIVCNRLAEDGMFWDSSGNVEVNPKKLGINVCSGRIEFASKSRRDVELWTIGALSILKMLKNWAQ